jgi:hypothetical protein
VCTVGDILVYEVSWAGVACCWNWPEAGHLWRSYVMTCAGSTGCALGVGKFAGDH